MTKMWDLTRPLEEPESDDEDLDGHETIVTLAKISPKGTFLATGSVGDCRVKVWDPVTKDLKFNLKVEDGLSYLAFSPDETCLAAATGGPVKRWNLDDNCSYSTIWPISGRPDPEKFASAIGFSPEYNGLAISMQRGITHLWRAGVYENGFELKGYDASICQFSFSEDGEVLATRAKFEGVQVWDMETQTCKATLVDRKSDTEEVVCIALSPDGKTLISSTSRRVLQVWDVELGVCKQTVPTDIVVKELSFTEDGDYLNAVYCSFGFESGVLADTPIPKQSGPDLYFNESWIMKDGQRLLEIPPHYNPEATAVTQNVVGLGGLSGQVIFLDLADS
jgi:WD40 repeat protein